MSNVTYPVLNPNTSLAFLPPDSASQLEVYRYLSVATLGAFSWNLFSQTYEHYKLLFKCRVTLSTVAYFVSILSTLFYIIGSVVFYVGNVPNCEVFATIVASGYTVAIPATSILFLLRIYALFRGERFVICLFSILWLGVLGCAITLPLSISGTHIGPTQSCINSNVKNRSSAGFVAAAVFDSLVFVSISWRLLDTPLSGNTIRDKLKTFCGFRAISALTKYLLRSGRLYYLITFISNIATTVLILSPSVPPILHAALTTPNSGLTNAMACKIFRDLRLGDFATTPLANPDQLPRPQLFSTLPTEMPVFAHQKSTLHSAGLQSGLEETIDPNRSYGSSESHSAEQIV